MIPEHQLASTKFLRGFWIKHRERSESIYCKVLLTQFVVFAQTVSKLVGFQVVGVKKKKKKKFTVTFVLTIILVISMSLWMSGNGIYFLPAANTDHSRQASPSQKLLITLLIGEVSTKAKD